MSNIRPALDSGRALFGGWLSIPSALSAEFMGRAGFDWLCIDTQHGLIGYDHMAVMLQVLSGYAGGVMVRVPWNQPDHIMKALDAGADGVIVPMVNSPEEARRAVEACRYSPEGSRSWGPIRAATKLDNYTAQAANESVVCAIQVESREGADQLDAILDVPGIDLVYLGPADLAVSLGYAPTFRVKDMKHADLLAEIHDRCRKRGVATGIHCADAESARYWAERSFSLITVGSDRGFMVRAASQDLQALRG